MRADVVTLFPELFQPFLALGMVGRAVSSGALAVRLESLRAYGLGRHKSVDDTPYGGGSGMVMRVDCVVECLEALDATPRRGRAPTACCSAPRARPSTSARPGTSRPAIGSRSCAGATRASTTGCGASSTRR